MKIGDTWVDTDGKDGLWVHVDGELTKIANEDELNDLSADGYGGTIEQDTVLEGTLYTSSSDSSSTITVESGGATGGAFFGDGGSLGLGAIVLMTGGADADDGEKMTTDGAS